MAQETDLAAVVSNAAQDIGSFIRTQREAAQVSVRQLAERAGVSNPTSVRSKGAAKPSAEVLSQIAKALRLSAEVLYVRAGIPRARRGRPRPRGHHGRHGDHWASEAGSAGHLRRFASRTRRAIGADRLTICKGRPGRRSSTCSSARKHPERNYSHG